MTLAFLFPGQGSQAVGMGKGFVDAHPLARDLFAEANDALGFDLKTLCLEGPEDTLGLTQNAQPAILTVSVIAQRLLAQSANAAPRMVAGHSLGEYSALVAAGVLSFSDAVKAVHQRGKFMQQATPVGVGAMAAVLGMEGPELEALCAEEAKGQVVGPANFNAPGQIVISGHTQAVERVLARAKGKMLAVSAPFHSPLMAPAAQAMEAVLKGISFVDAQCPVVVNVDNRLLNRAGDFLPSLVKQITSPVRWDTGVRAMAAQGITTMVELGHGKVLAGLNKRIDKSLTTYNVGDDESLQAVLKALFS
ncbi:MAG: ACP S-malonyltransferase [Deltaproteobacteria bacterium]|nr:ACP S-malonyltransferase [Deltaproteobacteria bacterium]MDH4122039.1 ACP S-malonyltransferase [Deltaproteobacteria bacterium]